MSSTPNIGFVSLGCPKNLVDSERILTELRSNGYNIIPSYENADLVIVNTCGFIDSAVQESLEAIGEALEENGKVIVTACLGAKEDQIRQVHPKVLEILLVLGFLRNSPKLRIELLGWILGRFYLFLFASYCLTPY